MKSKTHQEEERLDEFCREVVQSARASDEDIYAAANAPFLYQRLRAQVAAEQTPIVAIAPQRTGFLAAVGALLIGGRWLWAGAAAAVFLGIVGWQFWSVSPALPPVAKQSDVVTPTPSDVTPGQEVISADASKASVPTTSAESKAKSVAVRQSPRTIRRFAAETVAEETEIATEFMPLTYAGNRDDEGAQIVRMEVPREALIALGISMAKELTSERIKADIKLGDDGVAFAIRLVSNNNE